MTSPTNSDISGLASEYSNNYNPEVGFQLAMAFRRIGNIGKAIEILEDSSKQAIGGYYRFNRKTGKRHRVREYRRKNSSNYARALRRYNLER